MQENLIAHKNFLRKFLKNQFLSSIYVCINPTLLRLELGIPSNLWGFIQKPWGAESVAKVTYWPHFLLNSYEERHKASYKGTADLRLHTYQDSSVAMSLLSMRKAKDDPVCFTNTYLCGNCFLPHLYTNWGESSNAYSACGDRSQQYHVNNGNPQQMWVVIPNTQLGWVIINNYYECEPHMIWSTKQQLSNLSRS